MQRSNFAGPLKRDRLGGANPNTGVAAPPVKAAARIALGSAASRGPSVLPPPAGARRAVIAGAPNAAAAAAASGKTAPPPDVAMCDNHAAELAALNDAISQYNRMFIAGAAAYTHAVQQHLPPRDIVLDVATAICADIDAVLCPPRRKTE